MISKRLVKGMLNTKGFNNEQCRRIHEVLNEVLSRRNDWVDIDLEDFIKAYGDTTDNTPVPGVEYKTRYITVRTIETPKGIQHQRFNYAGPNEPPPKWRKNFFVAVKELDFINLANVDLVVTQCHRALTLALRRVKKLND